jgi:hypothetical protein
MESEHSLNANLTEIRYTRPAGSGRSMVEYYARTHGAYEISPFDRIPQSSTGRACLPCVMRARQAGQRELSLAPSQSFDVRACGAAGRNAPCPYCRPAHGRSCTVCASSRPYDAGGPTGRWIDQTVQEQFGLFLPRPS